MGYAFTDGAGRRLGTSIDRVQLQPRGTGADASWSYLNSVILRPGRYAIRLAAASADGRLGSVEYDLDARLRPGEGAALSDVLILDPMRPAGQNWVTLVDGRVAGTDARALPRDVSRARQAVSAVAFDIADRPDGPSVVGVRTKPVSAEEGRRWTAAAAVDVRLLPPGDYFVVATAFDGDTVSERSAGPSAWRSPIGPSRREGPGRRSAWPSREDSLAHLARRMP